MHVVFILQRMRRTITAQMKVTMITHTVPVKYIQRTLDVNISDDYYQLDTSRVGIQ